MSETNQPKAKDERLHVLRQGKMLGPFTARELSDAFDRGEVAAGDFVQRDGTPYWQPLASLLPEEEAKLHGVLLPDWKFLGVWIGRRLWADVRSGAPWLALILAILGTLLCTLSLWPMILWLPVVVAAGLVAGVCVVRGKALAGVALLAAAALGPVAILFLLPQSPAREVAGRLASPAPQTGPPVVAALTTPLPLAPPSPAPVVAVVSAPTPHAVAAPVATPGVAAAPSVAPAQRVSALAEPSFPSLETASGATTLALAAPPAPGVERMSTPSPGASPTPPADLVQRHRDALLLVGDAGGAGSGFICMMDGAPRAITNNHVMAGMKAPEITRLQGGRVKLGAGEAAVGHDIFRIALTGAEPSALEPLLNLDEVAHIDDEIVVLGNSGGGGVVTKLPGKLIGIGPDRIEVSAEFIPGNSGSPIIHVPTGKVIGIATYLTRRYEEWAGASVPKGSPTIRRFGYRLDSVKQWEPVNWREFQAEAQRLKGVSELTEDVFDFLAALRKNQRAQFSTETLKRPATEWLNTLRSKLSDADHLRATQGFLSALRVMARADVNAADGQLRYDYFRRELKNERDVREKLYKSFDSEAKDLALPNQRAY